MSKSCKYSLLPFLFTFGYFWTSQSHPFLPPDSNAKATWAYNVILKPNHFWPELFSLRWQRPEN